jgi:hypothetical protein
MRAADGKRKTHQPTMQNKVNGVNELANDTLGSLHQKTEAGRRLVAKQDAEDTPSLVGLLSTCIDPDETHKSKMNLDIPQNSVKRRRRRPVLVHQREERVSVSRVQKELSELRYSATKSDRLNWKRPSRNSTQMATSLPMSLPPLHSKAESDEKLKIKDVYRGVYDKLQRLENSLNKQQIALLEQQANILQLRMSLVKTMMEFESTSKLIKRDMKRMCDGDNTNESLHASWSHVSSVNFDNEHLHNSWPPVQFSGTSTISNESSGDAFELHFSPEQRSSKLTIDHGGRLMLDIHTIHESISEDLSLCSSGGSFQGGLTPQTSLSSHQDVITNVVPSTSFVEEPDGGRIPAPVTAIKSDSCLDRDKISRFHLSPKELVDFTCGSLGTSSSTLKTTSVLEQALQYIADSTRQRVSESTTC